MNLIFALMRIQFFFTLMKVLYLTLLHILAMIEVARALRRGGLLGKLGDSLAKHSLSQVGVTSSFSVHHVIYVTFECFTGCVVPIIKSDDEVKKFFQLLFEPILIGNLRGGLVLIVKQQLHNAICLH